MWTRGIAGIILCAGGAVWIVQGSGGWRGMAFSGHRQFVVLGAAVVIVGLALLAWAALIGGRRT